MLTERVSCIIEVKDWQRMQAAEMNGLRSEKDCCKINKTRNEYMIISKRTGNFLTEPRITRE
jgi:hypothetical protein